MCGIALIFKKNNIHEFSNEIMDSMLNSIEHRGRDYTCINHYTNCSIGFCRLAITDIDINPPSIYKNWICYFTGEIYNYKELGFGGSECNVLSQGFDKYGVDFVKQLNGMFVIVAISPDNQVYVFRDRYGIKPAYYYETEDIIIVSSEIKPILKHPSYNFSVNESAKEQWLTFNNVFTNETLFSGIYKLDKGTIWHLNTNQTRKYWEWKFTPTPMDFETAKNEVRRLLVQSIQRMIPKEVSYVSCLSGGVDSNIIASQLPKEITTYVVGYDGADDEIEMARLSGRMPLEITFGDVIGLRETIYHLEDLRVGACWSNYGLFEYIAFNKNKVVFDGSGGDELFGGYSWRYTEKDYYNVVNRTKRDSPYCKTLLKFIFPEDTLENRYKFDAEHFLEGVLLVTDRMSMAHTLEVRVPFLDNDLVDFCLTLPNEFKENKLILKEAFKDVLHPDIYSGAKKGFSSPDWFPKVGNQAENWAVAALKEWTKLFIK